MEATSEWEMCGDKWPIRKAGQCRTQWDYRGQGADVASWRSHFKVVSGGHAVLEGHGGDWSRDASGVTRREAWSVGATLGRNEQETMDSERHNGFRGAMGDRDPKQVCSVGNTLG